MSFLLYSVIINCNHYFVYHASYSAIRHDGDACFCSNSVGKYGAADPDLCTPYDNDITLKKGMDLSNAVYNVPVPINFTTIQFYTSEG